MSKMTNEDGTVQIPDMPNSADLSGLYIRPTNGFCPSSVLRGPIRGAKAGAIATKKIP